MLRTLNILQLNISGIQSKSVTLKRFLDEHSIHLALLQETLLPKDCHANIPGYHETKCSCENNCRGLVTLVKRGVSAKVFHTPVADIDAQRIVLTTVNRTEYTLYNIYCPPKSVTQITIWAADLTKTVFAGDFNAQLPSLGYERFNERGRSVQASCENTNLKLLQSTTSRPTLKHKVYGTWSRPDLTLVSGDIAGQTQAIVLDTIGSDHLPILIRIADQINLNTGYSSFMDRHFMGTSHSTSATFGQEPSDEESQDLGFSAVPPNPTRLEDESQGHGFSASRPNSALLEDDSQDLILLSAHPPNPAPKVRPRTEKCQWCVKKFATKKSLQKHVKKDHLIQYVRSLEHQTDVEHQTPPTPEAQTDQAKNPTGGQDGMTTYKCSLCPREYLYIASLKKHQVIKHSNANQSLSMTSSTGQASGATGIGFERTTSISSPTTPSTPSASGAYSSPTTPSTPSSSGTYVCHYPGCGKLLKSKQMLEYHTCVHTGERRYKCTYCPKTFITSGNKRKHEETHRDSVREPLPAAQPVNLKGTTESTAKISLVRPSIATSQERQPVKREPTVDELVKQLMNREDAHKCEFCRVIFEDPAMFYVHKGMHHDQEMGRCKVCEVLLEDPLSFTMHFKNVHKK